MSNNPDKLKRNAIITAIILVVSLLCIIILPHFIVGHEEGGQHMGRRTNVILQYAGLNVTYDDLLQNAKNKYQFDMGGDVSAIKNIDLYVKPDEGKVYFVINK